MASDLSIKSLTIRGFRNLTELVLEPSAHVNVISGDNGQGKTSVLEAVYWVCTTRSFRTERLQELRQFSAPATLSQATIAEQGIVRSQRAVLGAEGRRYSIDEKPSKRLMDYAVRTPVVVFQPGDLQLISGSAGERRLLLDRVSLFIEPASFDHRQRFARAQRERQRVLETRGVMAEELAAFEQLMGHHGASLAQARARATEVLVSALNPIFSRLTDRSLNLGVDFIPGGPTTEGELRESLAKSRAVDQRRKSTTVGPHRDDLALSLDGHPARRQASQGQQRILVLALKMAELACLREARGVDPVLLLDDVSSELDPTRTGAVYDFVKKSSSQIFVTTTRPELFQTPEISLDARRDFRLEQGALASEIMK
jgi:DNA replication and repair protein RecF